MLVAEPPRPVFQFVADPAVTLEKNMNISHLPPLIKRTIVLLTTEGPTWLQFHFLCNKSLLWVVDHFCLFLTKYSSHTSHSHTHTPWPAKVSSRSTMSARHLPSTSHHPAHQPSLGPCWMPHASFHHARLPRVQERRLNTSQSLSLKARAPGCSHLSSHSAPYHPSRQLVCLTLLSQIRCPSL